MNEAKNIKAVIARHTTIANASETANGLVPAMRQLVMSPSHADIAFNIVDLGIINSYRKSDEGRLAIDSYVPALEQALSRPDQYSIYEIGQILSAAREAEQRVYRIQFERLINSLSPDGQRKIRAWLAEGMQQIQYTNVDWAAVGEAAPEYIRSMAKKFATSVQRRAEQAALRQKVGQQT